MNNCVICGKDSGKGKTCSPKCKQLAYRNRRTAPTVTKSTVTPTVTEPLIKNFGESDCECQMCKTNRVNGNHHIINHGAWKPARELGVGELNRVTLPGDPDYWSKCKVTAEDACGIDQIRLEVA